MKCNLVLDEAGSFAHQYHINDIICMAKGMGNGFPIGGILIAPHFKATVLGTTFGGSHLACSKYRCFRYYRKSELNGNAKMSNIFHGSHKSDS
jgi:acetylornithine/succinyldiaminopimelate/putrescine aminotransferase